MGVKEDIEGIGDVKLSLTLSTQMLLRFLIFVYE